ncbi:MAG: PSD1 and planctomycete cytochrome C domain-containing protein [Verrucomicrobiota bacterium]
MDRILSISILLLALPLGAAPESVTFNAHVRPILSENCFACHGFDAKHRASNLRLDTLEGALATDTDSGKPALIPGNSADSELIKRLLSSDPDEVMPPPKFHKTLNNTQIATLKQWIDQGAKYEKHWSYRPITRPEVPGGHDTTNAIDAFVRERLKQERIEPSPTAEPRQLIRRLSLDLTGLPPTPDEVAAFENAVARNREQAVGELIDRLFASPAYGERMAVPWLDAVRFADTVGYHGDQNQHIFPYRDYVIDAFNSNKRFDIFTREQLAGDLMPDPTEEQLVASGFNRLNMVTREGGAQPGEYLAKYTADRVRAVGGAWLGQTTGCAECHDHKFDPITMRDFYELGAFFSDLRQWGVYSNYGYTPNADLKGFNNNYPFPPELLLRPKSLTDRLAKLRRESLELAPAGHQVPEPWLAEIRAHLQAHPDGWATATIAAIRSTKETKGEVDSEQFAVFSTPPVKDDVLELELTPLLGRTTALQLEVKPTFDGRVGRTNNGNFAVEPKFFLQRGKERTPLEFSWQQADRRLATGYVSGRLPTRLPDRWLSGTGTFIQPGDDNRHPHHAVFILKQPLELATGDKIIAQLKTDNLASARVRTTRFAEPVPGEAAVIPALAAAIGSESPNEAQRKMIRGAHALATLGDKVSGWPVIRNSIRDCEAGYTFTMISEAVEPEKHLVTRVLPRGNWQDESGDVVEPATLHFLPAHPEAGERRLTRLDLADWIVAEDNPLTARHFANRLWKQFFGNGISNILDDLGSQGEWPSHPLLIDWLAAEFRDSGWDMQHMVRLIVSSQTYQQMAAHRPELLETDPANRLLAQQSARRLDAEFVRDNALAIAGLLDRSLLGGPSIAPPQPAGYYAPIQFPGRRYVADLDDQRHRRSLYMHWQRTFLHPMLAAFDAPAREECAADRLQSNSPQQALTLLNDPNFHEAAKALATRLLTLENDQARIHHAYELALAREPDAEEASGLIRFVESQRNLYREKPEDAKTVAKGIAGDPIETATAVQLARVILNLHETITRY